MILQIDATVEGPDGVMTGSTAVTVNPPAPPPAPAPQADVLANLRTQQRSRALRWSGR